MCCKLVSSSPVILQHSGPYFKMAKAIPVMVNLEKRFSRCPSAWLVCGCSVSTNGPFFLSSMMDE